MTHTPNNLIGRCRKPHGIRGEVKVESYTRPMERILEYAPWYTENNTLLEVASSRLVPGGLLVKFSNHNRIEDVEYLRNTALFTRSTFVSSADDGYFWQDLLGMRVVDAEDVDLGIVDGFTTSHPFDLMIIAANNKHRYIPCDMQQVIRHVDLDQGRIQISWHAQDFDD